MPKFKRFSTVFAIVMALTLSATYLGGVETSIELSQEEQDTSNSVLPEALGHLAVEQSLVQEEGQCGQQTPLSLTAEEFPFDTAIEPTMELQLALFCNCNSHQSCNDICGGPGVCHFNQCSTGFYNGRCFCYPN